ncbi:glycine N-acyltransferase-like [Rhinophrynus dorsalis]
MHLLTCSSKLASLQRVLTHSFPESLKVSGALHHVIQNNPFKLQVLVDDWPDFTSVLCRPHLEEMTDPSDPYTNTYFLFSKDHQSLTQMLQEPQTINWKQELQIQGCQTALGDVLRNVSAKYGSRIQATSNLLYMKESAQEGPEEHSIASHDELQFSPLLPQEACFVNSVWAFGNNERSLRYVERCIESFPTICVRKMGLESPLAWAVSEQSAEIRMGYTKPMYRNRGLATRLLATLASINHRSGAPMYCHVSPDNKTSQASTLKAGFRLCGRWEQWTSHPSTVNFHC